MTKPTNRLNASTKTVRFPKTLKGAQNCHFTDSRSTVTYHRSPHRAHYLYPSGLGPFLLGMTNH